MEQRRNARLKLTGKKKPGREKILPGFTGQC
jgi:hypothetical protein